VRLCALAGVLTAASDLKLRKTRLFWPPTTPITRWKPTCRRWRLAALGMELQTNAHRISSQATLHNSARAISNRLPPVELGNLPPSVIRIDHP